MYIKKGDIGCNGCISFNGHICNLIGKALEENTVCTKKQIDVGTNSCMTCGNFNGQCCMATGEDVDGLCACADNYIPKGASAASIIMFSRKIPDDAETRDIDNIV